MDPLNAVVATDGVDEGVEAVSDHAVHPLDPGLHQDLNKLLRNVHRGLLMWCSPIVWCSRRMQRDSTLSSHLPRRAFRPKRGGEDVDLAGNSDVVDRGGRFQPDVSRHLWFTPGLNPGGRTDRPCTVTDLGEGVGVAADGDGVLTDRARVVIAVGVETRLVRKTPDGLL